MESRVFETDRANAESGVHPTIHVLATTPEGTSRALTSAKRLAQGMGGRIVLLVPRLASAMAPFDPTSDERAALIDRHRAIAADVGAHVEVLFCVCRHMPDVVHSMLGKSAIIVIGGRRNALWMSQEERLARQLTTEGYPVVFAQVGADDVRGVAAIAST